MTTNNWKMDELKNLLIHNLLASQAAEGEQLQLRTWQ